MFTVLLVLTVFSAVAILFAGVMAFASNTKKVTNAFFLLLSTFIALWLPANFLGSNVLITNYTKAFVQLDFTFALFIGWSMLYFANSFTQSVYKRLILSSRKFMYATLILNITFATLIISNSLFTVSLSHDELQVSIKPLFSLYVGLLLFYIGYALVILRRTYQTANSVMKAALNLVFLGLLVAAVANILTNLVFPEILNDRGAVKSLNTIGYIGILFFVISIYFAITTRKLFDVRILVARSIAYSLLLITTSFMFIGLVVTVPASMFGAESLSLARQIYYTFAAVILAFGFQPLKRFFDRLTNKLFYQDAYDSQIFLDELNRQLVSTVDLNKLLQKCAILIEDNLKPTFCTFVLKETEYEKQRIIGRAQKHFIASDVAFARATLPKFDHKVIVADTLDESNSTLRSKMRKNSVAVLVRLTSAVDVEGVGVIVLGEKKSGNMYNSQDLQVLDIIANSLVIAIDNALRFEEIQKFNVTLEQKVEDATRKLRRANDKLIALDQTKDDFISMASHQLRTPLTSVKGYLSMVLEGDTGKISPQQAKMLEQAFTSSQRMVYLIADLLNVSRLRTGKFVIETKPTNLAEVIEGEIDQLKTTAAGKNQKLTYSKPKSFPTLLFDETKIRQVIMNFTDNALHYTPNNGKIHVALDETPTTIQFTVTDNGIGIPKHEQHHLFTKFFRAGNARKARPDGTGLGLFMAKKVIIAQGGSVIFKSQEGKGSTFGFTFSKASLKVPK